jgi:competence protein ComEC
MQRFFIRPLFLPAVFFMAGILISGLLVKDPCPAYAASFVAVLSVFLVLSLAFIRFTGFFRAFMLLFFLFLGMFRYAALTGPACRDVSFFLGESPVKGVVYGIVSSDPERFFSNSRDSLHFDLELKRMITGAEEKNVSGKVKAVIYGPKAKEPRFADRVVMSGTLSLPPRAMNPFARDIRAMYHRTGTRARFYSSERDIFGILGGSGSPLARSVKFLSVLRKKSLIKLKKALSGPGLAMAEAMTLGIRSGMDARTGDILKNTGTMHMLAVSGLHVGLVAVILLGFFRIAGLPNSWSRLLAGAGMLTFAVFAGARASSLRAAIMGGLLLMSSSLGRKPDIVNALGISAFIITFFDPGQFFRLGFVLSYLAVVSIWGLTPVTGHFLAAGDRLSGFTGKIREYLLKAVSVSLAVWIGTMPVVAANFNIVTPSCLVANIAAVSAAFVIIVFAFFVLILPGIAAFSFLTAAAAFAVGVTTQLLMKVLGVLASLPGGFVRVSSPGAVFSCVYYAALVTLIFLFRRRKKRVYLVCFLLIAANLFVFKELRAGQPGSTRITFFHTGKSDAFLMEFPDRGVMLIDAGTAGKGKRGGSGRNVIAPYLTERGIRKIDCAIITHPHEDHIGGYPHILDNFKIGAVITQGPEEEKGYSCLYSGILGKLRKKNIPLISVSKGDKITGFPYAEITVLNPPEAGYYATANNDSVVVKVVTGGGGSILFSADAEVEALTGMLVYGKELKTDILKVPHHAGGLGDRVAAEEFLKFADARYLVVTNEYGCGINEAVMKFSENSSSRILLTGEEGAITVTEGVDGFIVESFLARKK